MSQSFTQLIQQGCSTNVYSIYTWFDITTTLCYPCYLFKYVYLHISSPHSFLNTPLSMLHTSKTSSGPPKKKINLQSTHSTRLSSFHLGTHHRSTVQQIVQPCYTSIQKLIYTSTTT